MRALVFLALALFLLPSLALAQAQDECLVDGEVGRVSGKVEFVTYKHPGNGWTISGYKLILLWPRCFEMVSLETNQKGSGTITEVAIQHGGKRGDFLKSHVGKTIAVTGSMFGRTTIYYVTSPAIFMNSMATCTLGPKTKTIEKC